MAKYGKYTDAKLRDNAELEQLDDYEEIMAAVEALQKKSSTRFILLLAGLLIIIFLLVILVILGLHYGSEMLFG